MWMILVEGMTTSPKNSNSYAPHMRVKIALSVAKSERRLREKSMNQRVLCEGCLRPDTVCLCEGLPSQRIATDTHILVLQHPNEFKKKTISTVPLMPLVLEHITVRVGYRFEPNDLALVREALAHGQVPLLLFPGPDALSLDTVNNEESFVGTIRTPAVEQLSHLNDSDMNHNNKRLLILIDGTWSQASRMARESPSLVECCQAVQFTAPGNSIYDAIRKEPEQHCLSTLECCARALVHLETDKVNANRASMHLEAALRSLVDQQQERRLVPVPRHAPTTTKLYEKNRQRYQIEQELFPNANE
jgi:DTW domain-containing protein YfiP